MRGANERAMAGSLDSREQHEDGQNLVQNWLKTRQERLDSPDPEQALMTETVRLLVVPANSSVLVVHQRCELARYVAQHLNIRCRTACCVTKYL